MNISKIISLTMLIITVGAGFASIRPVKAIAAQKSTFSTDLNGDGRQEKVRFKEVRQDEESYKSLYIYVNGKKKKAINVWHFGYEYKLLKIGRKHLLYVHTGENNGDGPSIIYGYTGGKLKKLYDFNRIYGCRWVDSLKTNGNQIRAEVQDSDAPGIGYSAYKITLNYRKGRISLNSNTADILWYSWYTDSSNGQSVAIRPTINRIPIYSDKKCSRQVGTIPVGSLVKVTQRYANGTKFASFHVMGDGYDGWYSSDDYEQFMKNYDWENEAGTAYLDGCGGVA